MALTKIGKEGITGISNSANANAITIDSGENIALSGTLNVAGETTLQTHLNLGDNDKIKLGAGSDLEIYHDASNSYVKDAGTGSLVIEGANVQIQDTQQDLLAKFNNAGAVQLYHVDSGTSNVKLATNTAGVAVTGNVIATSVDNQGARIERNGTTGGANIDSVLTSGSIHLRCGTNEFMRIQSAGNVGIGITNPSSYDDGGDKLVIGDTTARSGMTIVSSTSTAGSIHFADGTSSADSYRGIIAYYHDNNSMRFFTNGASERMRVHSGGQISIATTDATHGLNVGQSGTDYRGRFQGSNQYRLGLQSGTSSLVWLGSGGADNFRVSNSSGATKFEIDNNNMKVNDQARAIFQGSSNGNTNIASGEIFGATNDGNPAFSTGASFCQLVGITYSSATGRFTVPTAGRYLIYFQAYYNAGAASCRIATYINTVQVNLSHNASIVGTLHVNFVANMGANDYIDFRQISGGTQAWYMGINHLCGSIVLLN